MPVATSGSKLLGDRQESGIRKKVEWMIEACDLHFFVGTLTHYPSRWIIVGLWYPPRNQQGFLI